MHSATERWRGLWGSYCQRFWVYALSCYRCLWKGESFAFWKCFLSAREKAIWGWYKDSTPVKILHGRLHWEETAGQKRSVNINRKHSREWRRGRENTPSDEKHSLFSWQFFVFGCFLLLLSPPPIYHTSKSAKQNWFFVQKHESVLLQLVENLGALT